MNQELEKTQQLLRQLRKEGAVEIQKRPVWPEKREISADWRKNIEIIKRLTEIDRSAEIFQLEAKVNVPSDIPELPVIIAFPADMHWGSMDTDYNLLEKHLVIAFHTPNVFFAPVGDDIDFGMWQRLRWRQAGPVWLHSLTLKDLALDLRGEKPDGENQRDRPIVLFRATGNHGDTLFQISGHEWAGIFYGLDRPIGERAPIFPSTGLARVGVGEQEYEIAIAHKFTGHSSLNIFLPCIRMMEYFYPNIDIGVVAHHHVLGKSEETRGGRERVWIRPGTYRTRGYFERFRGWRRPPEAGTAAIMLYPNEHKMVGYKHFEDAVEHLHEKHLIKQLGG